MALDFKERAKRVKERLEPASAKLREQTGLVERSLNRTPSALQPFGTPTTNTAEQRLTRRGYRPPVGAAAVAASPTPNTPDDDVTTSTSLQAGARTAQRPAISPLINAGADKPIVVDTNSPNNLVRDAFRTGARSFGDVGSGATVQFTKDAQANGFRGTVLDSSAFREQAAALSALNNEPTGGNDAAIDALRKRVARGGFGSLKAASALSSLLGNQNEAQANALKAGTAKEALGLAKLGLEQQKSLFDQSLKAGQDLRAGNKMTSDLISTYVDSAVPEEQRPHKYRAIASAADSLPGIQDVRELDRVVDLLGIAADDTGVFSNSLPGIESLSQIQDIRENNGLLEIVDAAGKPHEVDGVWPFKDMNASQKAELLKLWKKGRAPISSVQR